MHSTHSRLIRAYPLKMRSKLNLLKKWQILVVFWLFSVKMEELCHSSTILWSKNYGQNLGQMYKKAQSTLGKAKGAKKTYENRLSISFSKIPLITIKRPVLKWCKIMFWTFLELWSEFGYMGATFVFDSRNLSYETNVNRAKVRGKSLLELRVTTFLPNWKLPIIFVWFISNFLCMCSKNMVSPHVILK